MFWGSVRCGFSSLGKYGRAVLCIFVLFGLFFSLFVQKNKLFVLEGTVETNAPVMLTAYAANGSSQMYSVFSSIKIEQDKTFRLEIKANNVYALKIVFDEPNVRLKLSDFRLIGKSVRKLVFDNVQTEGIDDIQSLGNGSVLAFQTQQAVADIVFPDFEKMTAMRVYQVTPFAVFLLLPLLLAALKSPWRERSFKVLVLLLPLLLLCGVKYFSFRHSFNLYYREVSFYNIFLLEKYEFGVFAAVYALMAAVLFCKSKILRFIFAMGLTALFMIVMIDGIILHNLNARFVFNEVGNYNTEYMAAFWMTLAYLRTIQGRLMLFCGVVLVYILKCRQKFATKGCVAALGIAALLLGGVNVCYKTDFLFDYEFYNVFQANKGQQQSRRYGSDFQKRLLQSFDLMQKCDAGLGMRKNVIIVIAESLSDFTSRQAGGIYDYMPEFDKLVQEGVLYTDYYSNSYNTTGGIFSLMSGLPAIHDFSGLGDVSNSAFYNDSLPKRLKKNGYLTHFFTSIELNGPMRDIVDLSGFDVVSDFSDPYYDDKQRFMFNAPADEHLFANVIRYISRKDLSQPYLMVVSTISGHGPYINPDTKKQSFEETVRYVDKQIGKFVDTLKSSDFFKDGILLITGDHRAMLPVSAEERVKMKPLAEGRVPMLIIGHDIKTVSDGLYSHNDVAPSLQYYLTEEGCFNAFQHNMFKEKKGNNCLIYQKLSPRQRVELLCDDGQAAICLNGDDTSFCDGQREQKYVDFINWLRLQQQ